MNYQQTLEFLYSQLPLYQRVGAIAHKANLDNTIALAGMLNNPEKRFKSIHVAGTNGKGSVSHALSSIFQEAGYKTGLYTSPHFKDFRERIKINGQMIPEGWVVEFVEQYKEQFMPLKASFFEITVGMAFKYFADSEVDIAIIETGLGGRLDSTNIISPELCVITSISIDHTNLLGNSFEEIAKEKAGIIKQKTPVVVAEQRLAVHDIFRKTAANINAPIFFCEDSDLAPLPSDLIGIYQQENMKTVHVAAQKLVEMGWGISEENIESGALHVVDNTDLKGRWQILKEKPLVVCDIAHNEDGVAQVLKMIDQTAHKNLHIVWGMVNDKDISKILSQLPKTARYYFCKADIPRGLDSSKLIEEAKSFQLTGEKYNSVSEAFNSALESAKPDDMIFVGGSAFVVAEVL